MMGPRKGVTRKVAAVIVGRVNGYRGNGQWKGARPQKETHSVDHLNI